jgi:hypothetical protein
MIWMLENIVKVQIKLKSGYLHFSMVLPYENIETKA